MLTFALTGLGAVLGLLLGSFANVVIARVPEGKSVVSPPSACPKCGYRITWRDNIPIVSYLLLGGKCRQCQQPISKRYPIVEAVMSVLFAVFGYWYAATDNFWVIPGVWAFTFASICLLVIDMDTFRLPNAITYPLTGVMAVLMGIAAGIQGEWSRFATMCFGIVFLAGTLFLVNRINPKGMGLGDVKYAIPMGITLGYFGIGTVIVGYFLALFIGVGWGIALMAKTGFKRRAAMPFGPGLVIGALAALLIGEPIAQFYMALTGL